MRANFALRLNRCLAEQSQHDHARHDEADADQTRDVDFLVVQDEGDEGDGRHAHVLKSIERTELLILDDWGLSVLTATKRRDLLEILEDRQGRGSTIVTSQLPVDQWHEAIGDPTLADAILDRLVHNAHRLKLTGDSMRRKLGATKPLDQNGQD